MSLWIEEADEEKGHIILPGNPPKTVQVRYSYEIPVAILLVADCELFEVGAIMHIPAENDGAETEAAFSDGKELFLGNELATEETVDVYTGQFDLGVALEELGDIVEGDLGGGHGWTDEDCC